MTLKTTSAFVFIVMTVGLVSTIQKDLRLNDLQVIGSHNSYKIAIEEPLFRILSTMDSARMAALAYDHPPLTDQLGMGLRNLELDVFHDPHGGRYMDPKGLGMVKSTGSVPLDFDMENKLSQPGLKLFHIQDIDFRSHDLLFKEGLETLKNWSVENPDHTPIFILINAKDSKVEGTRDPLTFTAQALDSIDLEIRSVFDDAQLITPDLVRGEFATLEEAILNEGWPKLSDMKGRFLFVLDEKEAKYSRYLEKHPGLRKAVLFVNETEGNPNAAFRVINDPIKDFDHISSLVDKGYIVRTRADAGTKEARSNDYHRFEKAKASGAQIISTDYYIRSQLFPSSLEINFGSGKYERIQN
ncbi:MAG: phosphatidylinositol-specific phospholipase C1-like protein [Cyclobacteriaceae bacterium]